MNENINDQNVLYVISFLIFILFYGK